MAHRTILRVAFAAILVAGAARAQTASLPTSYSGPWLSAAPPDGWTFSGLGFPDYADYDGAGGGAAKLDDAGDFISIHFDLPAASLSFWIKGLSFAGGVFRAEQSVDGTYWLELAAFASPPTNATLHNLDLSPHARHVRLIYSERGTGNVGLDGIALAKSAFFVIERFERTNELGRVWITPSVEGRLYGLQHSTNPVLPAAWIQASASWGTGGELELIDPVVHYPRFYRVVDVTPE